MNTIRHIIPQRFMLFIVSLNLIACTISSDDVPADEELYSGWETTRATKGNTKYSSLDQVNKDNVRSLEVAWVYRTGEDGYTIECNPIVVNDVLYGTTPQVNAFALNAATGEEIWKFDAFKYEEGSDRVRRNSGANRGVTYWTDGENQTIFFGKGPFMYALDAKTGKPRKNFAENGRIDLLKGLDREIERGGITASSPGMIYKDLLIIGAQVGEGAGEVVPGHVRAYDVRTGKRVWIFHTIPHPGEFGYETWSEDSWKTFGGANAWSGFSLDEKRGLLFFGTGSGSNDHFGIGRQGDNLFGNCVMALNVETGERVWHYQTVHHDLWDYDLPTPPNLITVNHNGKAVDAVAQVSKVGMVFLFDRETGEPLFPIEERPVRQTTVPGEVSSPTQPFPTKPRPYARHGFDEHDITDRTVEAHEFVRKNVWEKYGKSSIYDPPSFEGGVVFPQFNGGTDWGGAAVDPESGWLYVNASNEPELTQVLENEGTDGEPFKITGHQPVKDHEGYPISTPPWGTLSAIDLNEGNILWQIPVGNYPGMEGEPATGTFNMGGPIVTKGGLVFTGGSMDEKFWAFDKQTGEKLWEFKLPAGGYATPATYEVDGRQYVVIAAGGGGKPGTKPGDSYVAFALPVEDDKKEAVDKEVLSEELVSDGGQLYISRCATCHQYNGLGVGADFPPLINTEWVTGDKTRLIKVVLGGLTGKIHVNGKTYEGSMPPWRDFLNDEQLASILTYIRSSWGNSASGITDEEVKEVRMKTSNHTEMWTENDLSLK